MMTSSIPAKTRTGGAWPARLAMALVLLAAGAARAAAGPQELLYYVEGEKLHRLDLDTIDAPARVEDLLIGSTGDDAHALPGPRGGGNVNGTMCFLPDGRFVMGEDAGQPHPPPGWGVFSPDGKFVGKLVATGFTQIPDPSGCAVDAQGHLITAEVGDESFQVDNGQLILWFPPYEGFPGPGAYPNDHFSTNYCKLAIDIGTATNVAFDDDGSILVTSPKRSSVYRFSGTLPTSPDAAGGCGRTDSTGAPLVDAGRLTRTVFTKTSQSKVATPSGIAHKPGGGWYLGDVLVGRIAELDAAGNWVRWIVDGGPLTTLPTTYGNPQSIAVDAHGTLYYADLALVGSIFTPDTGSDGKVRRVRFDASGNPMPPEVLESGLGFPDGVAVHPGNLQPTEWRTLGGGPNRLYYNPGEDTITAANVGQLVKRWEFGTTAIVTDSPTVAAIDLPGEGLTRLAFFEDWNGLVYAVRIDTGDELWRFQADEQPGSNYPGASSADVERIDGRDIVYIAYGEAMYALDAKNGTEIWRFTAGTGCRDASGMPPGLCGFGLGEEGNEIESTGLVANGLLFFGMDVNDTTEGKGGLFAVDARSGALAWYFDFASQQTCRAFKSDFITQFDGYHTPEELGLPPDFSTTRPGCDFDRTPNGCGNVWSSVAIDPGRGMLFTDTSNCDVDNDPATLKPPPPMPPFDEAIFAFYLDGTPAWRWRPREVDPNDLDFGAVPNLFSIRDGASEIDVVGVGGKDGTYYVLDRDGVNERNGVAWNDPDPSMLPYWRTQVVPGGSIGGIIASAAADVDARRIYFSTGPGLDVFNPQRPVMHALDMDTGAVLWEAGTRSVDDASYAPTSAIPGVALTGAVLTPSLRAWDGATGALLFSQIIASPAIANAITSAATVVDGTLLVGTGIGARSGDPHDVGDQVSRDPRALIALCVPGTRGCGACQNGIDDDHDGYIDMDDPGCDDPSDPSEKTDRFACDDGVDNDGDGKIDMLDPGCPFPWATTETPQCDNGIDDDGNGLVDFHDPKCSRVWPYWESRPCGLGAELVLVLPLLGWARRRARG